MYDIIIYNFEMIFYLSCMPRFELDKNKSYYKTLIFLNTIFKR